ncbi:MAG: bacillithiol biosynthesis deacetylase BshB1 [Bacteroidetes bacterium]|nr:bacillithiol biosynthesis deacetylase BshB1 [Bacteroidota bacterium]MBU1117174.1 bacillithiol biosynthesis deacetylase BshB1 [Bacteroidota bacterium]MBU1798554.1 bacillithiol biosynthesis deacetylase BshB1 [Bacteroidota bacterium]
MNLDILIFAAHPDDAELGMGGTIAKLVAEGKSVGIVDFTEAGLSSNGTIESRKLETTEASKILNVSVRENLKVSDGKVKVEEDIVKKVITLLRKYKPRIVFAPYFNDRHPDHIGASKIVKEAVFFSGLIKIETELNGEIQEAYRPDKLYYYMQTYEFTPSFVVDITEHFETKMKSIRAYKSQFYNPDEKGNLTFISDPKFVKMLEARARYFGFQIRKEFGEPFFSEEAIELEII